MPDISIVIPVYNRCADLRRALSSLMLQTGCTFEIIVIDDNSTDQTVKMIKDEFPSVRLFCNRRNYGPSHARNIGINEALGRYILFLDSDTALDGNKRLTRFLAFFKDHPEAGTVGGEIRISGDRQKVYGRLVSPDGNSTDLAISNREGEFSQCDFLATCCCMVRTDLARQAGGFDPYYGFGGEDKDFGFRISRSGYKNYISADCTAEHYHSPAGRNIDETYRYHRTRIRFILKNYPPAKQAAALIIWVSSVIRFYVLCGFKIGYMIMTGKKIVKEHWQGGYLLACALYNNLAGIRLTRKCRRMNFLDKREMEEYVRLSESG